MVPFIEKDIISGIYVAIQGRVAMTRFFKKKLME